MAKHSKHFAEVLEYCENIKTNKILSGVYTKKAVNKFLNEYKESKDEGYPFYIDEAAADEVIDFAENLFIPDINKNLHLLSWMKFIYYNVFGWRYKSDSERRRIRTAFIEVARKNSKTTSILFPFILYDFLSTPSAESYFTSADDKQAYKNFQDLAAIVKANPDLDKITNKTIQSITYPANNSRIMFFSADTSATDSYKNSFSVIDEFWNYSSDKIVSAFKYGGRARKNSATVIITTAGSDISTPCYAENQKAKKILSGIMEDDSYFGLIYEYDEKDDWQNEKNLIKANPSLGEIVKQENLLNDLKDAVITPSHKADFVSKTCNIWSFGSSSWINIEKIEQNKNIRTDESKLLGADCTAALDLSSVNDWTVFTLCFKTAGKYIFEHRFYVPEDTIAARYRNENININDWIENKMVIAIPGATIDYDFIFKDIEEAYKKYNIKELCYDRYLMNDLITKIENEIPDLIHFPIRQNIVDFSPITKDYEKKMIDGEIVENNPIMKWMIGNVEIKPDVNGNYKPMKKGGATSTNRIDGVITSIMSLSRFVANEGIQKKSFTTQTMLNSF